MIINPYFTCLLSTVCGLRVGRKRKEGLKHRETEGTEGSGSGSEGKFKMGKRVEPPRRQERQERKRFTEE
jgi:hypothetical protein